MTEPVAVINIFVFAAICGALLPGIVALVRIWLDKGPKSHEL